MRDQDHPVATGTGAAAGAVTGMAIGAAGGPIGAAIGAALGGIGGAATGSAIAEYVSPDDYDDHWRTAVGTGVRVFVAVGGVVIKV